MVGQLESNAHEKNQITSIVPDSPVSVAALMVGDKFISIDGQTIENLTQAAIKAH